MAPRQEADLHEAPPPPDVSGRPEKAQGHLPPAQESEEAASCERLHHGLDGGPARGPCLQLRSEEGTLHSWGT